jgi:hypothetical protein
MAEELNAAGEITSAKTAYRVEAAFKSLTDALIN